MTDPIEKAVTQATNVILNLRADEIEEYLKETNTHLAGIYAELGIIAGYLTDIFLKMEKNDD
jgi:hypothetical protein